MNPDDPYIYYSSSDGRTWTKRLPERVLRDLALCQAIDALGLRLRTAQETVENALRAVQAAAGDVPSLELIATWTEQTAALVAVIQDLDKDGTAVIDAAQRALGLK